MKYLFIFFLVSGFSLKVQAQVYDEKNQWHSLHCNDQNIMLAGGQNILRYIGNHSSTQIQLPSEMHITALFEANQQLLIGTKTGELFSYSLSRKKFNYHGNVKSEISAIKVINRELYISTLGKGYWVINPRNIKTYNASNGLKDNYIYKISQDSVGQIWCCSDKGFFQIADSISYPSFNPKLKDIMVTAFQKEGNLIFCGTQNGELAQINLKNDSIEYFEKKIWKGTTINDIEVSDSYIVIATNMGAFAINRQNPHEVDTLILNKKIYSLRRDHSGALWLCGANYLARTYFGIYKFESKNLYNIHTLINQGDQKIWFTPDQGLAVLNIQSNEIITKIRTITKNHTDITCMFVDVYDNLWFGTTGNGLFHFDTGNNQLKNISIDPSFETAQILSITGNNEKIWIATLNGVWYTELHDPTHRFYSLEAKLKLNKYFVFNIFTDKQGILWLATDGNGILKVENDELETFSKNHQIESKVFYSIIQDSQNNMWFNAYQDGLYCYTGDSIIHVHKNNGLQSNEIQGICKIKDNQIAAVSILGIDLIDLEKFSVTQIPFSIMNLQIVPELNGIATIRDKIFLGTDKGILSCNAYGHLTKNKATTFIESIEVMEIPIELNKHFFHHHENYLKIITATGLTPEEKVFTRYKLEGLNKQWINTLNNEIIFPRLNPGSYTFRIQSANNLQFHNPGEASYSFTIDSPFYSKWWFLLLLLGSALFFILQYIRYRETKVTRLQLLQKEKAIAEFEALKAQINPHFLFNSFNTLIQVIDENKQLAIEYTQHLSDFYRSLIAFKENDLVSLAYELEILDNYFYLQKMRYGDSLLFHQNIPHHELEGLLIPPLTLQMLAENAIKHNIISDNKNLVVSLKSDANSIIFENNLQHKIGQESGEQLGLQNIKNRYKHYVHKEIKIVKNDSIFAIHLPKIISNS